MSLCGWRTLTSPLLLAVVVAALAAANGPAHAQSALTEKVLAFCVAPPLESGAVDRMRRGVDYIHLLDGLANTCPEVALVLAEFVVGTILPIPDLTPLDYVHHTHPDMVLTALMPAIDLPTGSLPTD